MNKITVFLVIVIVTLSFGLGAAMQSKAQAQAQDKTFSGIVPFVTSNDRVGFFNQNNGKIYMYDSDISQCLFVGQVQSLGQAINMMATGNAGIANR